MFLVFVITKERVKNRIVWRTKFRRTVYMWSPLIRYVFTCCRMRIHLIQLTMFQMMIQRTYLTLIMSLCVSLTRCRDLFLYGDGQRAKWAKWWTGEKKRAAKPFSAAFSPQSHAGYFLLSPFSIFLLWGVWSKAITVKDFIHRLESYKCVIMNDKHAVAREKLL